jgi:hypothetical protein
MAKCSHFNDFYFRKIKTLWGEFRQIHAFQGGVSMKIYGREKHLSYE